MNAGGNLSSTQNLQHEKKGKYHGCPKLYNSSVPADRGILIHTGNFYAHTTGCQLPGKDYNTETTVQKTVINKKGKKIKVPYLKDGHEVEDIEVTDSKKALKEIDEYIELQGGHEKVAFYKFSFLEGDNEKSTAEALTESEEVIDSESIIMVNEQQGIARI